MKKEKHKIQINIDFGEGMTGAFFAGAGLCWFFAISALSVKLWLMGSFLSVIGYIMYQITENFKKDIIQFDIGEEMIKIKKICLINKEW